MHLYFKYDTIFTSDLYGIYNDSPRKSHTDQPLLLCNIIIIIIMYYYYYYYVIIIIIIIKTLFGKGNTS